MDNSIIKAAYHLSANEQRLILAAIAQIPKGQPINPNQPYYITREDFVRMGVHPDTVAREIRAATKDLMKKSLTIDTLAGELEFHWLKEVLRYDRNAEQKLRDMYPNQEDYGKYINVLRLYNFLDSLPSHRDDDDIVARIVFNERIIPLLSELKENFTQFLLDDVAGFSSIYSFRIYQLMMQFKSTGFVRLHLDELRYMLALGNKYSLVADLKRWVIDIAINEINEKSSYTVSYELIKRGRKFAYLELRFKEKTKPKTKTSKEESAERDPNCGDLFTIDGLSDAQLARIANNPLFIAHYNHLLDPMNPANQNPKLWAGEMVKRLKANPDQFDRQPLRDYLDYQITP